MCGDGPCHGHAGARRLLEGPGHSDIALARRLARGDRNYDAHATSWDRHTDGAIWDHARGAPSEYLRPRFAAMARGW